MSIVLIEGWDHISISEMTAKGWSANGHAMVAGRFDGQAMSFSSGQANPLTKALPSSYATLIAGVALQTPSLPSSTQDFMQLKSGATATLRLGLTSAGLITVRNSGGTVIATGTTPIAINSWNYIEVKLVVGTSGTCEVHLNGVVEISSTVGNFGTTNVDTYGLAPLGFASAFPIFDDCYAADTSGSAPQNTFLGDVRVETIYPTGAGAHSDWTPNSGTTHYTQVNEAQADGDTTYVSDSTPGHIDTYAFGDIDTGATVYAVQPCIYARKDDANTRQIARVTRQGGTDYVGSTFTLASTYSVFTEIDQLDPTGSAWTPTTVNADEFGVKEIA